MRVLLLAGLGPYIKNDDYLQGTLLDKQQAADISQYYRQLAGQPVSLDGLQFQHPRDGKHYPVLRPRQTDFIPHLTSYTLRSILDHADVDYEFFDLEGVWSGAKEPVGGAFDVVALSTTFICDFATLHQAISWCVARYPQSVLVVGGQYSNLKFARIMNDEPVVRYIIRGDGEVAFPRLLAALQGRLALDEVPNLVLRDPSSGAICQSEIQYIDMDAYPSPQLAGTYHIVPYETMRGCPFSCKFCSFPAASPKWRYKSAEKISQDWTRYAERNGTQLIRAMDSTFTVPPSRFKALLEQLPAVGVPWEAYTRANVIRTPEIVAALERACCKTFSIGFESMSDTTLRLMNKRVKAAENLRAFELLSHSAIDFRVSFMVGYPGETPQDYEETHRFIVDRFSGRFMLSVFSLVDETMPVWEDADMLELEVVDPQHPDYAWRHKGMDVETARSLYLRTIEEARWHNDEGVLLLWQAKYEIPLVPDLSLRQNYRVEKLIERLAFLARDFPDREQASQQFARIIHELDKLNIALSA